MTNQKNSNTPSDLFFDNVIGEHVTPLFQPRPWLEAQVDEQLKDPGCRFLLLTAEPGAGKTAFAAWLAHRHPDWLRYFIRGNRQTLLPGSDARSFLFTLGYQLACLHPTLFHPDTLEVTVSQRINTVAQGGNAVGVQIKELAASPFYKVALKVEQAAEIVAGELVGLSITRATPEPRFQEISNLQYLALLDPARARLAQEPQAQVVVLVDALDELRFHLGEDDLLAWLATTPELPANLRFVLTSRPDARLDDLRRHQQDQLREIHLDMLSPDVQEDLRQYATGFAQKAQVALPEGDFLERAVAQADGNFQYLVALLRGLQAALSSGSPEEIARLTALEEIPAGLNGVYTYFLNQIRNQVAGKQQVEIAGTGPFAPPSLQPAWEWLYLPALGVLAVARQPLSFAQIKRFAGIRSEERWLVKALSDLAQFLDQEDGCYHFFHSTFAEFITSPAASQVGMGSQISRGEWNTRVVAAYRQTATSWAELDWSQVDDYGLRYLPSHLYELQNADAQIRPEFYALYCRGFARAKRLRYGSHVSFARDLDLLLRAAQAEEPSNLGQILRGLALKSNLSAVAENIPAGVAGVLAQVGLSLEALDVAGLIQNPAQRREAFHAIAQTLLKQGEAQTAREALNQAFSALQEEFWAYMETRELSNNEIAERLSPLAVTYAQGGWLADVLAYYARFNDAYQASILSLLAEALARHGDLTSALQVTEKALEITNRLPAPDQQMDPLSWIAQAYAEAGQPERALELVERELSLAADTGQMDARWWVVEALARAGKAEQALAIAASPSDPSTADELREKVVRQLISAGDLATALQAAQQMATPENQATALGRVVEALANSGDLNQAQAVLPSIDFAAPYTNGLGAMFEVFLSKRQFAEAHTCLEQVQAAGGMKDLPRSVSEQLQGKADVPDVDVAATRVAWLLHLAVAQASAGEAAEANALILEAQEAIGKVANPQTQSYLQKQAVQTLVETGDLERAGLLAEEIKTSHYQAQALSTIAGGLAQANRFDEALAAAERILDAGVYQAARLEVFQQMARCGALDQALKEIRKAPNGAEKAGLLAALAQVVAEQGDRQQAKALAQEALLAAEALSQLELGIIAVCRLAEVLVTHQQEEQARQLAGWSQATAERIGLVAPRAQALGRLAPLLARAGDTPRATAVVNEVLQAGLEATARVSIMSQVGRSFAQAWQIEMARQCLNMAIQMLPEIQVPRELAAAEAEIVAGLVSAADFQKALDLTREIPNPLYQVLAYCELIDSFARYDRPDLAKQLSERALSLVQDGLATWQFAGQQVHFISNSLTESLNDWSQADLQRVIALARFAKTLAAAGDPDAAQTVAVQAQDVTGKLGSKAILAAGLSETAQAWADLGRLDTAVDLAGQAWEAAWQVEDAEPRAGAILHVIRADLAAGDLNTARQRLSWALAVLARQPRLSRAHLLSWVEGAAEPVAALCPEADYWLICQALVEAEDWWSN